MEFITIPNCRLGKEHPYPETINVEHIVSFQRGRIDLDNGQIITVTDDLYGQIRDYLNKKGHNIVRLGD